MKSRAFFLILVALLPLLIIQPPLASVTAEDENLRLKLHQLEAGIEAAIRADRHQEAMQLGRELANLVREFPELRRNERDDRNHHPDEFERHAHEIERHLHEIATRRSEIDLELSEIELKMERIEFFDNPLAVSFDAIDMAAEHLGERDAVDFLSELLDEAELAPVRQRLRQRLVELNLELDRREDAMTHLRTLILATDE